MHREFVARTVGFPSLKGTTQTLNELYTEAEKYAKLDADHHRRVEQRKMTRQSERYSLQAWQQQKPQTPQLILPFEPLQDDDSSLASYSFMTPPLGLPEAQ